MRCQAAERLSGSHLPHGDPFLQETPVDDTRLVTCQVTKCGAGEAVRQGFPTSIDVTLSGAFNAPCQPAELGMMALFAILSVHNDYATVVTPLSYKRRPKATVGGGVRKLESRLAGEEIRLHTHPYTRSH